MSWLRYIFSGLKKVTEVRVDYSLTTKSGVEILEMREILKLNKPLIRNYEEFSWNLWQEEVIKNYGKIINKRAEEILNEYQKKERKRLKRIVLDCGEYIVKCSWSIWIDREKITYKEYQELKFGEVK